MQLAADGVPFLARRISGGYSVVMAVPGVAAVVEVVAPQLDALQVPQCSPKPQSCTLWHVARRTLKTHRTATSSISRSSLRLAYHVA